MRVTIFLLFLCLTSQSFAQYKTDDFKPLYRLASAWQIKSDKGVLVEQWLIINDSVMRSKSYMVNGKYTILQETVELKFDDGTITFTPTLPDQNQGWKHEYDLARMTKDMLDNLR